jgi:cell division protein FtsQ
MLAHVAGGAALRFAAWLAALALVALPIVAVMNGWLASDRWPFRELRIDAEFHRVSAEQVRAAAAPHLGAGFFAVDLGEVRRALQQLPWVEQVEVRKRWPDRIEVRVVEREAGAIWSDQRLVSTHGELFVVPGEGRPEGLPVLDGPEPRAAEMLAFFADAQAALGGSGLRPAALSLSPRGAWTLDLVSGERIVIGREEPLPRLHRLVDVLGRIEPAGERWRRVDLRYANGFALEWSPSAPPAPPVQPPPPPAPAAEPPAAAVDPTAET